MYLLIHIRLMRLLWVKKIIPIPEELFHYTTRVAALEYILPTQRIRLGLLGKTNDPREMKDWGFLVMSDGSGDLPWSAACPPRGRRRRGRPW